MSDPATEGDSGPAQPVSVLNVALEQAIATVSGLGDDFSDVQNEFVKIQQRLRNARFHLAVLGQFKRGKSTLLNALLGDNFLPTDILPVTAIPTFVQSGEQIAARIFYIDRPNPDEFTPTAECSLTDFLQDYVTEAGNPHNQRRVSRVEISHPAALLKQGVVLIDTPGVGSTLKHNTEVALQILSQCDAALFLVSPDPPITEMELTYLRQIKQQLPRTFYLLNKVDFLDAEEIKSSLQFLGAQLSQFYSAAPEIMPISARNGLKARLVGDEGLWRESGMQAVEQSLIDFFAREKQHVLLQAISGRCKDLLNSVSMQIQLFLEALKLPEDQLQEKIGQFQQSLPAIEREQQAVVDVLAGDLKRILAQLARKTEALRQDCRQQILAQIETVLETVDDPEQMEQQVRQIIVEQTEQLFNPAMQRIAEQIRRETTDLLGQSQQRSRQLVEQVRKSAAELFAVSYQAPRVDVASNSFEAPAWSKDLFVSDMDPLGQKFSRRFFSQKYRRRRTAKRLREESQKLINQNIAQIDWTIRQRLEEHFRQYSAGLSEQLEKTILATRKAMEIASQRKESRSQETAATEHQYQQAAEKLAQIKAEL